MANGANGLVATESSVGLPLTPPSISAYSRLVAASLCQSALLGFTHSLPSKLSIQARIQNGNLRLYLPLVPPVLFSTHLPLVEFSFVFRLFPRYRHIP